MTTTTKYTAAAEIIFTPTGDVSAVAAAFTLLAHQRHLREFHAKPAAVRAVVLVCAGADGDDSINGLGALVSFAARDRKVDVRRLTLAEAER